MSASIRQIQEAYVTLVLSHFVQERREHAERGTISEPPTLVVFGCGGVRDVLEAKVWNYIEEVRDFWTRHFPDLQSQLQAAKGLTVGVGGDMASSST